MSHVLELLRAMIAWLEMQLSGAFEAVQPSGATMATMGALLVSLFVLIWLSRAKPQRRMDGHAGALGEMTRYPRRVGIAAASMFVLVLGGWSLAAPFASAALAPGVISPDGHRKTIQHLEGGIIRVIHVREGDAVKAGAPLITLDDTKAKALNLELRERFLHLLATEARLEAERTDAVEISFPDSLLEELDRAAAGRGRATAVVSQPRRRP